MTEFFDAPRPATAFDHDSTLVVAMELSRKVITRHWWKFLGFCLVLGLLAFRSGSIVPGIVFHALNNALAVVMGNLTTWAVEHAMGDGMPGRFHPPFVFGPAAAITAIAIAWSREYSESTVQLFMVLPIRGRALLWITIGFCVLDLVYPAGMPEGVVAPFGGLVAGLLFGGSPSLARTTWLRVRLALLRRQSSSVRVEDVLSRKPARRWFSPAARRSDSARVWTSWSCARRAGARAPRTASSWRPCGA